MRARTVALAGASALAARWALRRGRRVGFEGASVVITGGSRGLGLELARCFAAERARLALVARDAAELERARDDLAGADVRLYPCDVAHPDEALHTVRRIAEERGGLDVLINNAGRGTMV